MTRKRVVKRSDVRVRRQMDSGCMLLVLALVLGACAGTAVVQKSYEWSVNEATSEVYKSKHELTRGRAGAAVAKLDTGALTTYVEVDEDGSYVIDMTGDASGADAAALSDAAVELGAIFSEMLPSGALVDFVAALKSGLAPAEIGDLVEEVLTE